MKAALAAMNLLGVAACVFAFSGYSFHASTGLGPPWALGVALLVFLAADRLLGRRSRRRRKQIVKRVRMYTEPRA